MAINYFICNIMTPNFRGTHFENHVSSNVDPVINSFVKIVMRSVLSYHIAVYCCHLLVVTVTASNTAC